MKKIFRFIPVLLLVIIAGCSPPEDDNFYSTTYFLCHSSWVSYSYGSEGEYMQHLFFYEDGNGKEIITYHYPTGPEYDEYRFTWQWYPDQTTIEMKYGIDDFLYFENVQVYTDYLKGILDGYYMEFESY